MMVPKILMLSISR